MTTDAVSAEDAEAIKAATGGSSAPLRLLAEDGEDLAIISAALQDAILRPADIVWEKGARRLTIELSRFCWECGGTWVRAAMQFGDVEAVKSRGLPRLPDSPLELLALHFIEGEPPGGKVILMFAGGGDLRVDVECLDAVVADLSERWQARVMPTHLDDETPMTDQRLASIELDEATLPSGTAEIEHERRVAVFDLVEKNVFAPEDADAGPYGLKLSLQDNRLVFDISGVDFARTYALSLTPLKQVLRDYLLICDSYYEALRGSSPSQIEAVDMGRRGLHNEGAELLKARLDGKVGIDHETARRLFTLVCALYRRG